MQTSTPFRVLVASTVSAIERYSNEIDNRKPTVIGFDIEGCTSDSVDLISIAENDGSEVTVYLFQVSGMTTIPKPLRQILSTERILKSGCGLINDAQRLRGKEINLAGMVELSHLARIKGLPQNLKELWNTLFPQSHQLHILSVHSAWNKELSPSLIEYASYDAYASLLCGLEMLGLKTETSEIISDDADNKHYRIWVSNNMTGSRSMVSLINQTISSYGPWAKKYNQEVRARLARHNLMLGVSEGLFSYDEKLNEFKTIVAKVNPAAVKPRVLSDVDLDRIQGLKYQAACNQMFNGSKTFNMLPADIRQATIAASIDEAVARGELKLIDGKLYR